MICLNSLFCPGIAENALSRRKDRTHRKMAVTHDSSAAHLLRMLKKGSMVYI